jgi:hypothetical protein
VKASAGTGVDLVNPSEAFQGSPQLEQGVASGVTGSLQPLE